MEKLLSIEEHEGMDDYGRMCGVVQELDKHQ